jgi:hypothetical protein
MSREKVRSQSMENKEREWLEGYKSGFRAVQDTLKEEPRYHRARVLGSLQGYGLVAQSATMQDWALGGIAAILDSGF